MNRESKVLAYVAFGVVCFVWGTTYLAIAVAIETLPVVLFPGLRFAIAGAVLLGVRLLQGARFPRRRADLLNLLLIGVLMVGAGNLCVVWAEHHVTSGFAALLVGGSPFAMALLERARGGERFSATKMIGLVIGFAGLVILVAPELSGGGFNLMFLLGVLAIQVGTIGWNWGSIVSKYHVSKDIDPIMSAALQMLFGGVFVSLVGLAIGDAASFHFNARTLAAFLYLVVFGSLITYAAYIYALSKLPTSTTSLYAYINPVVALFLGWLILDEPIGWNGIVGMIVIFTGVAFVQAKGRIRGATMTGNVALPASALAPAKSAASGEVAN
ncbi:MAG: EamA family transporter [Thermoanaerobaculia bacterium]|jgi:drug/metabolite transporter (DMT)-like permease